MATRQVYLYAFNKLCKIEGFVYLRGEDITIQNIRMQAQWMLDHLGSTCEVCAVDNRPGLKSDFLESFKSGDFTKHVEFEDLCCREGFIVMRR